MRKIFVFVSLFILMSCNSSKTASTNESTTFKVMFTSDYCGGAYPSDEILEALKKPKPLKGEEIYIKSTSEDAKFISIKTNEDGEFSADLAEGDFLIFLKEKIEAKNCEEWSTKANGNFTFTKGSENQTINVHRTCNPCNEPSR